jgi:sterol desaturase/sphingolipid hydroxylase (fatty acid hydroxylase superfamily)
MVFLISYKIVIAISWFSLIFVAERLFRAAPYPTYFSSRLKHLRVIKNMGISAVNMVLSPLLIIPLTAYISVQFGTWRPDWMQSPLFILVDLLLLDAFLYAWHRASHHFPLLWRFHQVHHLDSFLDSTTALRFHFGEVFLSAMARAVFIVLLDIPLATVIVFEICIVVFSVFNHSNLRIGYVPINCCWARNRLFSFMFSGLSINLNHPR